MGQNKTFCASLRLLPGIAIALPATQLASASAYTVICGERDLWPKFGAAQVAGGRFGAVCRVDQGKSQDYE